MLNEVGVDRGREMVREKAAESLRVVLLIVEEVSEGLQGYMNLAVDPDFESRWVGNGWMLE